ncbi:putative leucine-rich repeat receptor-like protein kinase [Dichanthelium oligosanthes]|uniref:Putative leucine-rich repeat receptor-like protein kinase n=1 Tax=Dichanthelium oligosanthes TaxID=888268 RepID=A0A1E5WKD0_9POAL|nr:putative leucine-rich repeat receptor-like protein kinase [Dichanthelium oligosanthes]
MLVAASLMAMETMDHHLARGQQQPTRHQHGGRSAVAVRRQQSAAAAAAAAKVQRQNVPKSPPPPAGGLSAEAFLVLACVAVSLIVLPLVLPPLPPPPPLLLLVPVCLLLLLAALATFMPSDVRTMASSYFIWPHWDSGFLEQEAIRLVCAYVSIFQLLIASHDICALQKKGFLLILLYNAYRSLNNKKFQGSIPPSLGRIPNLYWLDLGSNKLTGELPVFNGTDPGLDNLTYTKHFHFGGNSLSGPLPIQIFKSEMKLIHLRLDNNHQLTGPIPASISNLTNLAELSLRGNNFSGVLDIGSYVSPELQLIDLQDNQITGYTVDAAAYDKKLILVNNPLCNHGSNERYCTSTGVSNATAQPYATALNCPVLLLPTCLSNQIPSPNCICAVPYKGTLSLRAPPFSDVSNASCSYFVELEQDMKAKFMAHDIPVDSISIHDPLIDAYKYMEMSLEVFPSGKLQFSELDISELGSLLSNQTYKPPSLFGPYVFIGQKNYSFPDSKIINLFTTKKLYILASPTLMW